MLVINSNKNQFTINDMLGEPEYPNFNQILALGKANYWKNIGHGTSSSVVVSTIVPTDMPNTVVNGVAINNFAPKIYKEQTNFGNLTSFDKTQMPRFDIMCVDDRGSSGGNREAHRLYHLTYNIGISGLPTGAIVGEKMYGRIGLLSYGPNGFRLSAIGGVTADVNIYHSDGTATNIGTITMTGKLGDAYSQVRAQNLIYSGQVETTGKTITEGDIIVITVTVNNARYISNPGNGVNVCGVTFGGVYNYDYGAPDGFRPFQISIRGS